MGERGNLLAGEVVDRQLDLLGLGQVEANFGQEDRGKLIALAQEVIGVPIESRLEQNYPNPFNASTTIRYQLASPGRTRLEIFGLTGRRSRR